MIDAGIWGQLPSLINAGVIADNTRCIGSECSWPPVIPPPGIGNGFVSAGFTQVCSMSVTIPGQTVQTVYGFFDFTPGVGDDLFPMNHAMGWSVDGAPLAPVVQLSCPHGNVRIQRSAAVAIDFLTPGVHTLAFYYTVATTGVGFDILWAATQSICL